MILTQLFRPAVSAKLAILLVIASGMARPVSAAGVLVAGTTDSSFSIAIPAIDLAASLLPWLTLIPLAVSFQVIFSLSPLGGPRPRNTGRSDQRRRAAIMMAAEEQAEAVETSREVAPPAPVVFIKHGNWAALSAAVRSESKR